MAENARSYFRLQYPASARPRVVVADRAFAVLDLSEGGVKFATSDGFAPSLGERLRATIHFMAGDRCEVHGVVVRTEPGAAVLKLEPLLSMRRMIAEQRYVHQRFRMLGA